MSNVSEARLGLIPRLAEYSSGGYIGRTALMKYLYFLQTLRHVNLGYHFTLYSYGPFDSDVLADLGNAETLCAVETRAVLYQGGYGYQIRPGIKAEWLKKKFSSFLEEHERDVRWVIERFGSFSSSHLELLSTIIYVDREASQKQEPLEPSDLTNRVREIKPRFSSAQISLFTEELGKDGLLETVRVRVAGAN